MRRHGVLLLVLAVSLGGGIASGARAAQAPLTPVSGGIVQAFTTTSYTLPKKVVVPSTRYYFSGSASDQVNKLSGTPSATFSPAAPTGTSTISQLTNPGVAATGNEADNVGDAFWKGSFKGAIDGKLVLHWWWSTHDAAALSGNLQALVIADPGTPKEKTIGQGLAAVTNADGNAHEYVASVDVKGTVGSVLEVVGHPTYVDASEDLTALYGSIATPGYFEIPKGPPPVAKIPTNPSVPDDNPLVVASTNIGRKAAEPTIGVTKAGNAFITAADFDGLSPATPRTLIYSSQDGNRSWHNVSPLIAGQPTPPTTADPYLYVDPDTGRIYNDDLTAACSFLQWSDDEGKTWTMGNPLACEEPVDDHQTVVTGKPVAGLTTTGYPKIVYYCVNKIVDVSCARSLDGGNTFTTTGAPAYQGVEGASDGSPNTGPTLCGGLHGHIITDPSGRLYVPKGHCSQPYVAISDDGGSSWKVVRVSQNLVASHQTSIASDTAGNLYYAWFDATDFLPYLSVSRDHGSTWSRPQLIAPPGVAAVNYPTLDAREPGHLVVSFPGSTAAKATDARPWNYYVMASTNALDLHPTFHSATSNPLKDPVHRGACLDRCAGMYDFIDALIAPKSKELWAAGVDTCTSPACIAAKGPDLPDAAAAADAQGFAVRQISGPGLTKPRSAPVAKPMGPTGPATKPQGHLPATGSGWAMPALGLLLLAAMMVRRRRAARLS